MAKPTATFNASDLATSVPGLRILSTNPYRPADRVLDIDRIASSDKSVTSSAYFKDKKLNVVVEIGRDTRELLDDSIDTLNAILQPKEKALVLSVGSSTRQWTATYQNMSYSDVQGGHAVIEIEFLAADGIGTDVSSTSLFSSSLTGSSSNTPFIGLVGGTARYQQPIITITLNSVTLSGSTGAITVGNPLNGTQVIISRAFVNGDILVIDSKLKKVTVNGTEVAFTGSIPEWEQGIAGSMDYSDTFTLRNRSMTGIYYKRYA